MGMSDYVRGLRETIGHELLFGPAVASVVRDERGRILLVRHVEGYWLLPAGAVDPGETPADAARREAWEEARVLVEPLRILGVFGGGPDFERTYANGDRVAWIVTVFESRLVSGEPAPDHDETTAVCWADADDLASLELAPSTRRVLDAVREGRAFAEATWLP